jgi:tRNA nucleotidyltransferase (CCA-adding enzyme)
MGPRTGLCVRRAEYGTIRTGTAAVASRAPGEEALLDPRIIEIARAVAEAGGRALIVGGYVRDALMGRDSKDIDIELLGLERDAALRILERFGRVLQFGQSFEVMRLGGLDVDWSAAGGPVDDYASHAARRDLTINSMALDPISDELLDPFGGRADLEARRLRASDAARFGDDPLRALRVAQFHARFEMEPDAELCALCAEQDLGGVPGERRFPELQKLLLGADRPSLGFSFLERTGLLRFFPEISAMRGVPQDPEWHPEGDVFVHTLMVLDAAAALRRGEDDDLALMLGALCHDFGKPECTISEDGRIKSPGHDRLGEAPTTRFLDELRAARALTLRVTALVRHHLAPALFVRNQAGPRGYRRLARDLERAGVSLELLVRVARADHLGRTTAEARSGIFPAGDLFLQQARLLSVSERAQHDTVQGRHLIARGLAPGRGFGEILERCRAVQDELGETDPERILALVLDADPPADEEPG